MALRIRSAAVKKWMLVCGFWVVQGLVLFVLPGPMIEGSLESVVGTILEPGADYAFPALHVIVILMAAQAAMLYPVRRPRQKELKRHRLPGIKHVIGGFAIGSLVSVILAEPTRLVFGVTDEFLFPWIFVVWILCAGLCPLGTYVLWRRYPQQLPVGLSALIAAFFFGMLVVGVFEFGRSLAFVVTGTGMKFEGWEWALLGVLALSWAAFTPLLIAFCRRRPRDTAVSRMASLLFMGTIIEVAAIIPLDVMVRRKSDCYCGEGTFVALLICSVVGFFSLGPAIFLAPAMRRRKRRLSGRCEICGYDMSGVPDVDRCPECGAGWRDPG